MFPNLKATLLLGEMELTCVLLSKNFELNPKESVCIFFPPPDGTDIFILSE